MYLQSALGINLPRCIGRAHFNQRLIPADTCLSRAAMTRYILMLWIVPGIISTATLIEIKCLVRSLAFPERWHSSSVSSCRDKNLLTRRKIQNRTFVSTFFLLLSSYPRNTLGYIFSPQKYRDSLWFELRIWKFLETKADYFFTFLQF